MNAFKTSNSFVLKPIYSGTMTPSCEPFSEKLIRFPPTNFIYNRILLHYYQHRATNLMTLSK
jgi:hypothetical protein